MTRPGLIRIGALVSGSGSNLQAIIDAVESGRVNGELVVVISSNRKAYALERSRNHGIPTEVVLYEDCSDRSSFSRTIAETLKRYRVDLACLAGFTRILDPLFFELFHGDVMNIHPALLPAFGGKGMYGRRVHEAVIQSGARFSGATVHFVTEECDVGPIIIQDVVPVDDDDSPDTLAAKVLQVEHAIYPKAVELYCAGVLEVDGMRVRRRG
ncbi:MAG: phosphoribosylglycinamide formyltransferase [Bacillota bacterium]|jgi:phosphoribosylglycinamide formyltransferase-1